MESELIESNGSDTYDTGETLKKRGRLVEYGEKIAAQIVLLISESYSLRKTSMMPGMSNHRQIVCWQLEHTDFREGIAWMSWLWCAEAGRHAVEIIDEVDINVEDEPKQLRKAEAEAKALLTAARLNSLKHSPFGDDKQ